MALKHYTWAVHGHSSHILLFSTCKRNWGCWMTFLAVFRGCCGYMEVMHEVIHEVVGLRSSTLQWAPFPTWEITENQNVHQRRNATWLLEVYFSKFSTRCLLMYSYSLRMFSPSPASSNHPWTRAALDKNNRPFSPGNQRKPHARQIINS